MKKRSILISMLVIGVVAALIAAATTATFTDRVTSTGNDFKAGTLLMQITGTQNDCAGRVYGGDTAESGEESATNGGGAADGNIGCDAGKLTFTADANNAGTDANNMAPGDSFTADYTIENVGTLDGTLDVASSDISVTMPTGATGTCASSNFIVTGLPPASTPLAAGTGAYVGTVGVQLDPDAPNVCQGVTVTGASFTFHLVQAS